MAENKEAPKIEEPVTLDHIHDDLHKMKLGSGWYFIMGAGMSIWSIGMALLIRSLTEVQLVPAVIVVLLGSAVTGLAYWTRQRTVK